MTIRTVAGQPGVLHPPLPGANQTRPRIAQLEKLAAYYRIPVTKLLDPPAVTTDEERLADWRAELARAAVGLAHEDLEWGEAGGRDGEALPDEPPGRRSA